MSDAVVPDVGRAPVPPTRCSAGILTGDFRRWGVSRHPVIPAQAGIHQE